MYRLPRRALEWPGRLAPSIFGVHLRRALLLFALVLGLTALATALAPPPADKPPSRPSQSPAPGRTGDGELRIRFHAPAERPPTRKVKPDTPLEVTVAASRPGQARIPLLGRTASLTPADPARFDLLTPGQGRYDVHFTPTLGGEARRVGTIAVSADR
jgi:hypothetical protein